MKNKERNAVELRSSNILGEDLYREIIKQINNNEYSSILRSALAHIQYETNPYSQARSMAAHLLAADKMIEECQKQAIKKIELNVKTKFIIDS